MPPRVALDRRLLSDPALQPIADKVERGERLTHDEGVFLFKTPLGLRLRAAGENPRAVDTLGIDVFRLRRAATIAGGGLIGAAGAYLPIALTGTFNDNMTAGRGWLALMLVIFGRWQPAWVLVGALLFACVESLQFKLALGTKAIPPQFLLMLPYVFAMVVLVWIYRGAKAPAAR